MPGATLIHAHCLPGDPRAWRLLWRKPVDPAWVPRGAHGDVHEVRAPQGSGSPRPGESQGSGGPSACKHARPSCSPANKQRRELAQSCNRPPKPSWGRRVSMHPHASWTPIYGATQGVSARLPPGCWAGPLLRPAHALRPCGQGQLGLGGGHASHAGVHTPALLCYTVIKE